MNVKTLPKSSLAVQQILDMNRLDCKIVELPSSTRTANEAADAIGCQVEQIVKSLVFKTKVTEKPVLVLASGPNRVNEKAIKIHVNENIKKADADFVREITGFAIGGVAPIGHKNNIDFILIDQSLLKFSEIWAAAGTPNTVFKLTPQDLILLTNGKVIDII